MELKEQARWADRWNDTVQCPRCSQDDVHLGPVSVTQHTDKITIANKGWEGMKTGPRWRGVALSHELADDRVRGSAIQIQMQGECGHNFALMFQFHKGKTFIWYEELTEPLEDNELWRD